MKKHGKQNEDLRKTKTTGAATLTRQIFSQAFSPLFAKEAKKCDVSCHIKIRVHHTLLNSTALTVAQILEQHFAEQDQQVALIFFVFLHVYFLIFFRRTQTTPKHQSRSSLAVKKRD